MMQKEYMFASKLISLTNRSQATPRDLFDIHYFFSQNWSVAQTLIEEVTGKSYLEYISSLPEYIDRSFNTKNISQGLGELLENESQRDFVKRNLKTEVIEQLRFYIDATRRSS